LCLLTVIKEFNLHLLPPDSCDSVLLRLSRALQLPNVTYGILGIFVYLFTGLFSIVGLFNS